MDVTIPEEYRSLKQLAKTFREKELAPLESHIDQEGFISQDLWKQLVAKSKAIGLFNAFVPEKYGGGGIRSWLAHILVWEEIGKTLTVFRRLFDNGYEVGVKEATEEQIRQFYIPVWQGEKRMAYALTEPDAGSDSLAMKTTATSKGNKWVVNGMKYFVSAAPVSDFICTFAMTDKERRRVTAFLLHKDTPGITLGRVQKLMGSHATEPSEVYFDDCLVDNSNVLGEVGKGLRLFFSNLNLWRLRVGAAGIGAAEYAVEACIRYAKQRITFGQALAKRQAIQGMIIDSWIEAEQARWLTYSTCAKADEGASIENLMLPSAAAKVAATEMACKVLDRAIQIHGGLGYSCDIPFERMYRDIRANRFLEGANETLKFRVAAQQLFGKEYI